MSARVGRLPGLETIDLEMTYNELLCPWCKVVRLTGHVVPANGLRVSWLIVGLCHHRVAVLMRGCAGEESCAISRGRSTRIGAETGRVIDITYR